MLKKNVFSQKRFSFSGGFHRFIEQDVIVDNNSYVARKNKIRNRRENKAVIGQSTGEKQSRQIRGVILEHVLLQGVRTCVQSTYRDCEPTLYDGFMQYF